MTRSMIISVSHVFTVVPIMSVGKEMRTKVGTSPYLKMHRPLLELCQVQLFLCWSTLGSPRQRYASSA